ncbi:MAG: phage tail sheath subtilisin-like domain-containing protein [Caulobacteraceae bacterium]|nr:phage tail sheath subtilisin-like domain-containing protein [Caulobacteraceae bacterium]
MAQKFLSPGVFTSELDQSQLAQGVAGIGAALIGRTPFGPAFLPVITQGYDDFAQRFGAVDPKFSVPYAARGYLANAGAATVVRVLGHKDGTGTVATNAAYPSGWVIPNVVGITDNIISGSQGQVLLELHSQYPVQVSGVAGDANNFTVRVVSGSTVLFATTASFLTSSANYVGKVLNTDPTLWQTYYHYIFRNFKYATPAASASWGVAVELSASSWLRDFEGGQSMWVKSQPLGGQEFNMLRFWTRGHGLAETRRLKVTISNVKPSPNPLSTPYGTFDVVVRGFSDTDQRVQNLESFIGCTMDPNSDNYVLKRIGDQVETFDTIQRKFVQTGTWPAKSKLIWVEIPTTTVIPAEALPWGFRGYIDPQFTNGAFVPQIPYVQNQSDRFGNLDLNTCWGVQFLSGGIGSRMRPLPDGIESSGLYNSDADFSLSNLSASYLNGKQLYTYVPGYGLYTMPVYQSASLHKFTLPFRGGHDGWDIRVADPLYLNNTDDETILGVVAEKRAVDTIANPDAYDMNLLAIPNQDNLKITDYGRTMVNNRQDALYIMDVTGASVNEVVGQLQARQLDDNYTACYYPDLKLNDKVNKKIVRVKPSVAVVAAIAYNDRTAQPWFAPAGLNRGGLGQFDITDVVDRLTFDDRNVLYDNRINPIATFPDTGISIFGQKTLQVAASALDRVNVRRLLIYAKKTIASAAKYLVFEPDNPQTWDKFLKMVNPILKKVQQDQGLNRFKVVMDSTTNTPDIVDRNIMVGKIFLEPTKAAEFIDLQFVITAQGVEFGS